MATLDSFLEPLHHGVWEVTVPKSSVTESLGPGWKRSSINVPSPGTVASYRRGQYHAHETADEWRVHLDRYDPEVHPLMHLADDAPLLLMIADTFGTLLKSGRDKRGRDTRLLLEEQRTTWQRLVLAGLSAIAAGLIILLDTLSSFEVLLGLVIPLVLLFLGIVTLWRAVRPAFLGWGSLVPGFVTLLAGAIVSLIPVELFAGVILVVLGAWAFASASLSFWHLAGGRTAVPEGFGLRLFLGLFSVALAVLIFIEPVGVVDLLMTLVGALGVLAGIVMVVDGNQLRRRMVSGQEKQGG
ncbi:MAG: hypothetical protein LUQ25_06195 [Methanoregulaceae archaeon]|nr:hypothetical protein [Methanoregulaceae archaeon]